jgi:hypothetical protein
MYLIAALTAAVAVILPAEIWASTTLQHVAALLPH